MTSGPELSARGPYVGQQQLCDRHTSRWQHPLEASLFFSGNTRPCKTWGGTARASQTRRRRAGVGPNAVGRTKWPCAGRKRYCFIFFKSICPSVLFIFGKPISVDPLRGLSPVQTVVRLLVAPAAEAANSKHWRFRSSATTPANGRHVPATANGS